MRCELKSHKILPHGWESRPLDEVADILDRQRVPVNAKQRETRQGSVPYYGATGQVGWIDKHIFDEELVLLGEDGAPFLEPNKAKAYVIRGKTWVNNHAHVLRARAVSGWVVGVLLDISISYAGLVTGTTRLKLNASSYAADSCAGRHRGKRRRTYRRRDRKAVLPPRRSRRQPKRVKANLKRYKAAVLKAAVEGRLLPTEAELARREGPSYETGAQLLQRILEARRSQWRGRGKYREPARPEPLPEFALPEGWLLASMDRLASKITSGSRDWSPYYDRGTSIFVLAQNVRPLIPDFSVRQLVDPPKDDPSRDRSRIEDGDLLATIVGANTGQVCMVGTAPTDAYVCQSVALIRPVCPETAPYVNLWLNSIEHGQSYFKRCFYGQGRPHLSFEQLMSTPIALPPLSEQIRIVAEVDRRLSLVLEVAAEVDANIHRAQRLRQAALRSAFGGV